MMTEIEKLGERWSRLIMLRLSKFKLDSEPWSNQSIRKSKPSYSAKSS